MHFNWPEEQRSTLQRALQFSRPKNPVRMSYSSAKQKIMHWTSLALEDRLAEMDGMWELGLLVVLDLSVSPPQCYTHWLIPSLILAGKTHDKYGTVGGTVWGKTASCSPSQKTKNQPGHMHMQSLHCVSHTLTDTRNININDSFILQYIHFKGRKLVVMLQGFLLYRFDPLLFLLWCGGRYPVDHMVPFHHPAIGLSLTRFDHLTLVAGVVEFKTVLGRKE